MRYTNDEALPDITEETFASMRSRAREFTLLILKTGPRYEAPGPDRSASFSETIYAHGKRNAALHAAGLMPIICPVADGSDVAGIGVFDASPEDVDRIYAADPAVRAGFLAYEVHPCRSFAGSKLPD